MKKVSATLPLERANWTFNGKLVDSFDAHISRSVPLYKEGHDLICDMSDFFIKPNSICYEIGCSTGTLTLELAAHHKPEAHFIGVDIEEDMIRKSCSKLNQVKGLNVSFLAEDVTQLEMDQADLIVCYYTVQFINTSVRQKLIDKLYKTLNWGGALLLFEKVRGADARFQDIFSLTYNDFKLKNNFSPAEIIYKSKSLKGVMEPFSDFGNISLLKRAGFKDFIPVFQWLCFKGYLCIK